MSADVDAALADAVGYLRNLNLDGEHAMATVLAERLAAIRAEGLDVERLYRALETVAQWDPWADQWLRDHAAEYARLAEAER